MFRFLFRRRSEGRAEAADRHPYPCDGITVFCDSPDCAVCRPPEEAATPQHRE